MFLYFKVINLEIVHFWLIFRKQTYFVDLFVRVSNKIAINMYKNLGYIVYRTVIDYYAGPGDVDEDAYGEYINIIQMPT